MRKHRVVESGQQQVAKQRRQHLDDRPLHDPITHRWDSETSDPAVRFGDLDRAHRLRNLVPSEEITTQLGQFQGGFTSEALTGRRQHAVFEVVGTHAHSRAQQRVLCRSLPDLSGLGHRQILPLNRSIVSSEQFSGVDRYPQLSLHQTRSWSPTRCQQTWRSEQAQQATPHIMSA